MYAIKRAEKLREEIRESRKWGNGHSEPIKSAHELIEELLDICNEQAIYIAKLEKIIVTNLVKEQEDK